MAQHAIDLNAIKSDYAVFAEALRAAGAEFRDGQKSIRCPFHDDRSPSMSLYANDSGHWRARCHADNCAFSGGIIEIQARVQNVEPREILSSMRSAGKRGYARGARSIKQKKKRPGPTFATLAALRAYFTDRARPHGGQVVATYAYTNPETKNHDLVVFRIEFSGRPKTFRQGHQDAAGYHACAPPLDRLPLYNRTRLGAAQSIVVVEGEGVVHSLHELGIAATTSPGGAGKAGHADWGPLAGKRVYLWPDNDPADEKTKKRTGTEHMKGVADELDRLSPKPDVLWIDPETTGVGDKGDATDLIQQMRELPVEEKRQWIAGILEAARPGGIVSELLDELEQIRSGKLYLVDWPWPKLHEQTQALLPGTITVICGSPGASKSFMLLQALRHWHRNGHKCAGLMLEDTKLYHMRRAIAQNAGLPGMMNYKWIRANAGEGLGAATAALDWLPSFAHCIQTLPRDAAPGIQPIIDWVSARAAEGCRVVAIDPFSLIDWGDKVWVTEGRFIREVKHIIEDYGISLVLVTHPRKGVPQDPAACVLDDMAGSALIPRASQTAIWLHYHKNQQGQIRHGGNLTSEDYNRTLIIRKARNGPGQGTRLACRFVIEGFRLDELGAIEGGE